MKSGYAKESNKIFGLNWEGKHDAFQEFIQPVEKQLSPAKQKSKNWNNTKNLYIEGDNLDALKLLYKDYKNKIKVIYIDPPYNTGKDFTYSDKFKHSEWCSMIYPRLLAAQKLMSEDGVIFISIDDNELCNLKIICDEVFGAGNFITQFVYEKTQHYGRQKLNTYSNAEYILCYAKSLYGAKIKELLVERINVELTDAPLYNASNNETTLTFSAGTVKFCINDGIYKQSSSSKYELLSPVIVKDGKNINELSLKFKSRWSQQKVLREIKNGTTFLVKSKNFAVRAVYGTDKTANVSPRQIIFTNKLNKYCTISRFNQHVTTNETATKELKLLLGTADFTYPKPVSLISYLLSLIYDYKNKKFDNDFIVLDFFSGSATTAEAVMELNAMDGGMRKFILIQKPDLLKKDGYDKKTGFKNICELGEYRILEAGKILQKRNPNIILDNGFRVYKVCD